MMKMDAGLIDESVLDSKIELLKKIQATSDYRAKGLNEHELARAALKKMAFYNRSFANLHSVADAVVSVGEQSNEFHTSHHNAELAHEFHFASLGLSVLRFFSIPLMYLVSYGLKQKVPFTLGNNLRWGYSALVLTLAIIAMTVPIAAPIIGLVMVSVGLVSSVFFLVKLLFERSKLAREELLLQQKINVAEDDMLAIQNEAKAAEHHLQNVSTEQLSTDDAPDVALIEKRFKAQQHCLEQLYDKRLQNQQLKQELGANSLLTKGISLFLACAALSGVIVSLFFPPVGVAILAGVAVTGAAYALSQVLAPLFTTLKQWIANKMNSSAKYQALTDEEHEEAPAHVEHSINHAQTVTQDTDEADHAEESMEQMHESTLDVLVGLSKTNNLLPAHKVHTAEKPPLAKEDPVIEFRASQEPLCTIEEQDEGESDSDSEGDSESERESLAIH